MLKVTRETHSLRPKTHAPDPLSCLSRAIASVCSVNLLLLESGRDALHDLLGLDLVVNLESEEVARGSQLELCDTVSLVLLDSDLLSAGKVLLLSAHDLDELLQILDFLGLNTSETGSAAEEAQASSQRICSMSTYHFVYLIYNKY